MTLELIEQIKTNFNYCIYRSLTTLPSLTEIILDIIQLISPKSTGKVKNKVKITQSNQLALLKSYLNTSTTLSVPHRCLIILDEVQEIFTEGKLAGNYQPGYENYGKLFKLITNFTHQLIKAA